MNAPARIFETKTNLTQKALKRRLHYDPLTGKWTWLQPMSNRVKKGSAAGTRRPDGRLIISIDAERYLSTRLACLYMTGEWPVWDMDHKDLDQSNDVWTNLRPADRSGNMANVRMHSNNKCGFKGVYFNKRKNRYVAEITKNYKKTFLGQFTNPEDAHAAYAKAAAEVHGEYARTS